MPSPINQIPQGLLSLLSAKGQGNNPGLILDDVNPVLDVRDMYLVALREQVTGGPVAAAVGSVQLTALTVPAGEVWFVWAYCVVSAPGAGAACTIAPGFLLNSAGSDLALGPYLAIAATESGRAQANPAPFWLTAGSIPTALVRSQTLAPNITGVMIISRMRI
jgi:hypothetical protein